MEDKRKNNGGHSTKASGVDKRKNKYLHLLDEASTDEDVVKVIRKLKSIATEKGDVQAIKLFLEYYLGKPKETIDIDHTLSKFDIKEIFQIDKD
jgi:ActR/RegA family two-component response regulator